MRHKKGWQPAGWQAFVEACPTCLNLGSELCYKCKMEVESGYDPKDEVTKTNTGTYTMYGGQRGGGKIFFLETLVSFLQKELEEVKQDRDRWQSAALYYMEKANKKTVTDVTDNT